MGQVRVYVVFSRVGQSMEELLNEGLNDTGWDKELCDFVMNWPVPVLRSLWTRKEFEGEWQYES